MRNRFEALDGLRGLLACLVVVFHFWSSSPLTTATFVRNGFLAVDFFFVLSGFVIAANYDRRLSSWVDVKHFLVLRLGRLVPLHLATLAGLACIEFAAWLKYPHLLHHAPFSASHSPAALASNALLIQAFPVHDNVTWNAPSWSISAELWTYVMFAGVSVAWGWQRLRRFLVVVPFAITMLALSPHGMSSTFDYGLLRAVLGFTVGVTCWRLFEASPHARTSRSATAAQALTAAAAIGLLSLPEGNIQFSAPFLMGALVMAFARSEGLPAAMLQRRPIQWLGERSYSIYMVHWPLLTVLDIALDQMRNRGLDLVGKLLDGGKLGNAYGRTASEGTLMLALFIGATLAVSALTYRYIELPARLRSRRWVALQRKAAAVPGAATRATFAEPTG